MMGSDKQLSYIKEFAADNDVFRAEWANAFEKMSKAGLAAEDEKVCTPLLCESDGNGIVCDGVTNPGSGTAALVFDDCQRKGAEVSTMPPFGASCSLSRSFGVKGVFDCGAGFEELYCTTKRARQNEEIIRFEKSLGGDHDKCQQ